MITYLLTGTYDFISTFLCAVISLTMYFVV